MAASTDTATKIKELKAANMVRRVIQRIRLATPENFDTLESEAFDVMAQQLEDMGSSAEKVEQELEAGLELGRKRVQQVLEKREQEAEMAKRPKECMDEIKVMMESLEPKVAALEASAGIGGGGDKEKAEPLKVEACPALQKQIDECAEEVTQFMDECVKKAAEIKQVTLPSEMRAQWATLTQDIVKAKHKGERTLVLARTAIKKVTEAAVKEKVQKRKEELKDAFEAAASSVQPVMQAVLAAESEVEPFIKSKVGDESEMASLVAAVEEKLEAAKAALEQAREESKQSVEVDDEDENVKKQLEALVAAEFKRPKLRLGQMEMRMRRVANIIRAYKQDLKDAKHREIIDGLKSELLQKIKEMDVSGPLATLEPTLKDAEGLVQTTLKNASMSVPEMEALAEKVTDTLSSLEGDFERAEQALYPLDEDLDEDLKKKLKKIVAPQIKASLLRLGLLNRRFKRLKNLLRMFHADIKERKSSKHKLARVGLLQLVKHRLISEDQSVRQVFDSIASEEEVDETAFKSFVNSLEKTVKKSETEDSEETVTIDLTDEEISSIYTAFLPEGRSTFDKEAFSKCVCQRMTVAKAVSMTTHLSISEGKALRGLKVGEFLEVLEGPIKEGKTSVKRVKVRVSKDDKVGWVSVAGNAGSVFLKESK
mmetsp:Transcript_6897/g.15721  ORF Transcript_6897/g.15721 Transcript_6897/m.15721 type:complete len:654 (+) Transcript_6897:156-2117(+)